VRGFQARFTHPSGRSHPSQPVHAPTRLARPHSKYIAPCGRLPSSRCIRSAPQAHSN
jgi:hypothetical protein